MKKNKIQNIILYVINFILIGFIILSNKGIILNSNRIILKNMDESTQVNNLNKTIETLNNSHTEYANYIQTSKANLATAITNAGVATSGDATFETMITNVSNILSNKTNDATATAAEILSGKIAYVKGSKVTGTMANKGAVTANINAGESYTIPEGYHNGNGKVTANSNALSSIEKIDLSFAYCSSYTTNSDTSTLEIDITNKKHIKYWVQKHVMGANLYLYNSSNELLFSTTILEKIISTDERYAEGVIDLSLYPTAVKAVFGFHGNYNGKNGYVFAIYD